MNLPAPPWTSSRRHCMQIRHWRCHGDLWPFEHPFLSYVCALCSKLSQLLDEIQPRKLWDAKRKASGQTEREKVVQCAEIRSEHCLELVELHQDQSGEDDSHKKVEGSGYWNTAPWSTVSWISSSGDGGVQSADDCLFDRRGQLHHPLRGQEEVRASLRTSSNPSRTNPMAFPLLILTMFDPLEEDFYLRRLYYVEHVQ